VKVSLARVQIQEGGFGGSFWYLYPDSIETHEGEFPLTQEVTATVDNESSDNSPRRSFWHSASSAQRRSAAISI
jgi:hypothetical protein